MSEERYCSKCKKNVPLEETHKNFHSCGRYTVPLYSEEMRKRYRAEERVTELETQLSKAKALIRHANLKLETRTKMYNMPIMTCPKCGYEFEDFDGFGFIYCEKCHHCTHPNSMDGICGICGRKVEENNNG